MIDLNVPVTEGIIEAERAWAGGVADFGDHEAAYVIQTMPGYFDYRGTLEDELRRLLGDEFLMYRAMTPDAYRQWESGGDVGPTGFTLSEGFAKAWRNFAPMGGKELIIVEAPVRPEWVIMRGKPEEDELVVDGNQVSFDTLRIV